MQGLKERTYSQTYFRFSTSQPEGREHRTLSRVQSQTPLERIQLTYLYKSVQRRRVPTIVPYNNCTSFQSQWSGTILTMKTLSNSASTISLHIHSICTISYSVQWACPDIAPIQLKISNNGIQTTNTQTRSADIGKRKPILLSAIVSSDAPTTLNTPLSFFQKFIHEFFKLKYYYTNLLLIISKFLTKLT